MSLFLLLCSYPISPFRLIQRWNGRCVLSFLQEGHYIFLSSSASLLFLRHPVRQLLLVFSLFVHLFVSSQKVVFRANLLPTNCLDAKAPLSSDLPSSSGPFLVFFVHQRSTHVVHFSLYIASNSLDKECCFYVRSLVMGSLSCFIRQY